MNKKFKVPHTYVIIFCIILIAAAATYLVPAGQFDRIPDPTGSTSKEIVDPDSYRNVEQNPIKPLDIIRAIPAGMNSSAWIIFLIFIIGGSFGMINGTGAIEAGIGRMVSKFEGKEKILIPVTILIFSLGGATFGMAESTLVFIPMGIVLARSMGFDALVGMSMVSIGAAVGFSGGALNPFTVGVAQGLAGLPLFSGLGFRVAGHILFYIAAVIFITRYALKVKKNPETSIIYDLEKQNKEEMALSEIPEFTTKRKLVMVVVVIGFGFIVYGVSHGWSTSTDLNAIFLTMGIVAGLVGGNGPSKIAQDFVNGAKALTFGALVVGLSKAIVVVLESGMVIDTIIQGGAVLLGSLPKQLSAVGIYVFQVIFNFFVNSGSGQAATTIPIMSSLGDLLGITRQTIVLAYQYGDGLTNSLYPTSAVLMGGLSLAKIPYEKWFKYILPLMGVFLLIAFAMVMIATAINLGPF